ncbi:MAG TPA: ChaN family lipoprotein [Vicinamibacterales bacterium]|nr:ChaN family lipoprotein [Vicinamibacterales bacterium]
MKTVLTACAFIALAGLAPVDAQSPSTTPSSAYVPQRVYDSRRATFTDFEMMVADLARADVILIGEQHDDPNTHRLELAVLEGLARRNVSVTLSLEMFERDVQRSVDTYMAGSAAEDEFLKNSRPWPRYATDYRPLVEFARARRWPVVAANVPRRIAADVAKAGKPAVESLNAADRSLAAADLECPHDAYFDRFAEQMGGHQASAGSSADTTTERYYWAQCIKDETMAESIADAFTKFAGRPGVVVHVTGAFHSEYGEGTGERVRRRLAGRRVGTVSMMPVENLDAITPQSPDLRRADYLVYTVK